MNTLFLIARAVHVLGGAIWVGSVTFVTLILMPALDQVGPERAKVIAALGRRGITPFIAGVGGVTVLAGLYLYWKYFIDLGMAGTSSGMTFGTGGALGLISLILGGSVVGRTANKMTDIGAKLAATTDAGARAALTAELDKARRIVTNVGRLVLVLLLATAALMAIGHYV